MHRCRGGHWRAMGQHTLEWASNLCFKQHSRWLWLTLKEDQTLFFGLSPKQWRRNHRAEPTSQLVIEPWSWRSAINNRSHWPSGFPHSIYATKSCSTQKAWGLQHGLLIALKFHFLFGIYMIKFSTNGSPQIWDKPTFFTERLCTGVIDTMVGGSLGDQSMPYLS